MPAPAGGDQPGSSTEVPCCTSVSVPEPRVLDLRSLRGFTSAGATGLDAESGFTSGSSTFCENLQSSRRGVAAAEARGRPAVEGEAPSPRSRSRSRPCTALAGGRHDELPVVLSMLRLAQTWIVVQTGARSVTETSEEVHLPALPEVGYGWASVIGQMSAPWTSVRLNTARGRPRARRGASMLTQSASGRAGSRRCTRTDRRAR